MRLLIGSALLTLALLGSVQAASPRELPMGIGFSSSPLDACRSATS